MKVSRGTGRFSPKIMQRSILRFYQTHALFPPGITADMEAIDMWSLKMGRALSRLDPCLKKGYGKCDWMLFGFLFPLPFPIAALAGLEIQVSRFRRLMQLASSSKVCKIDELKQRLSGLCVTWLNCVHVFLCG